MKPGMKMKKKFIAMGMSLVLFGVTGAAQASIITDYYLSTITSVNGEASNYWESGDTFTWWVTYDDESLEYNRYYSTGELNTTVSMDEEIYKYFSHAIIEFDEDILNYIADSYTSYDFDSQFSNAFETTRGLTGVQAFTNDYSFSFSSSATAISKLLEKNSSNSVGVTLNSIYFTSVLTNQEIATPNPAPEPATILLFSTGIAGLVGYRRRKNKA